MDGPRRSTSMRLYPPSALVIACAPAIVERSRVAASQSGLDVLATDFDGAIGLAAARKPIALVVPDDLLSFEWRDLVDLARDVGATLLQVDADVCEREIAAMLAGAIDSYLKRGARTGAGRYAFIRRGIVEIVTPSRPGPISPL